MNAFSCSYAREKEYKDGRERKRKKEGKSIEIKKRRSDDTMHLARSTRVFFIVSSYRRNVIHYSLNCAGGGKSRTRFAIISAFSRLKNQILHANCFPHLDCYTIILTSIITYNYIQTLFSSLKSQNEFLILI